MRGGVTGTCWLPEKEPDSDGGRAELTRGRTVWTSESKTRISAGVPPTWMLFPALWPRLGIFPWRTWMGFLWRWQNIWVGGKYPRGWWDPRSRLSCTCPAAWQPPPGQRWKWSFHRWGKRYPLVSTCRQTKYTSTVQEFFRKKEDCKSSVGTTPTTWSHQPASWRSRSAHWKTPASVWPFHPFCP